MTYSTHTPRLIQTSAPPSRTKGRPPRLLDQVRAEIRTRHYSLQTEQAYVHWIKRFILFHGKRHPREMGAREVEAFLSDLAIHRHVAANTQNLALSALLFLYKEVLEIELPWLGDVTRAKKPKRLPTVLSEDEARRLMQGLPADVSGLVARLLYGTGMRLMEGVRLRVKDVEFDRHQIMVRGGEGARDRVTVLPDSLVAPFVCNTLAGIGLRHSHRAGIAGPRGREDHDDLHARPEPRWARRGQSAR